MKRVIYNVKWQPITVLELPFTYQYLLDNHVVYHVTTFCKKSSLMPVMPDMVRLAFRVELVHDGKRKIPFLFAIDEELVLSTDSDLLYGQQKDYEAIQ